MSNLSGGHHSHLRSSKYFRGKESNSPTLSSSHSEKSLWARSYKNEPIPAELRRRLLGKKYNFANDSDDEEEIMAVEEEQEQQQIQTKPKRLPRFKVISDWGEFSDFRHSRIQSERKREQSVERCKSVESLKLPQVVEEKREEDQLKNLEFSRVAEFKDNNEFDQHRLRRSSSEWSDVASRVQSTCEVIGQVGRIVPEQILENEAEETKSQKLPNQKSIITTQIEKLIVDELDQIKKRKEEVQQQTKIESIEQEKQEEHQTQVDTDKLRQSLSKFESESEYLLSDEQSYKKNTGIEVCEEDDEESVTFEQIIESVSEKEQS